MRPSTCSRISPHISAGGGPKRRLFTFAFSETLRAPLPKPLAVVKLITGTTPIHWTAPALRYKMFLAQNHPIRQGKSKPSRWRGRRLCRRRGASWVPPRGGAAEVRHCPVPVRCSGWGSVPGSAAPGSLVSRQAPVCGAGRRSPRTGGPQEGVLAEARVAAAQLSPSVLVANARRLGAERLHVKHGVCLMRFLD